LSVLREASLVQDRRDGWNVYYTEGTKLIELDRTEIFTHLRFWPKIKIAAGAEDRSVVEARTRRALQSAQKYSFVAKSVKSQLIIEPTIELTD
jgi:hypothetical protein